MLFTINHSVYPWIVNNPWRRERPPTPVFLPGESHGQKSLAGYSPWGHKESDMPEEPSMRVTHTHTHTHTHSIHTVFTRFMTSNTPSIWPWEDYRFCITWASCFCKSISWHGRIMLSFSVSYYFFLHLGVTEREVRKSPCINAICLLFFVNLQACKCLKIYNCHTSCQVGPLIIKKSSFSL